MQTWYILDTYQYAPSGRKPVWPNLLSIHSITYMQNQTNYRHELRAKYLPMWVWSDHLVYGPSVINTHWQRVNMVSTYLVRIKKSGRSNTSILAWVRIMRQGNNWTLSRSTDQLVSRLYLSQGKAGKKADHKQERSGRWGIGSISTNCSLSSVTVS